RPGSRRRSGRQGSPGSPGRKEGSAALASRTPPSWTATISQALEAPVIDGPGGFSGDRSVLGSDSTLEGGSVANMRRTTVSLAAVYPIREGGTRRCTQPLSQRGERGSGDPRPT